jgi:hypothetical protein
MSVKHQNENNFGYFLSLRKKSFITKLIQYQENAIFCAFADLKIIIHQI